ncbi:Eco57I restriction-modification methylase domain-containing protein [Acinetobacter seifertii]|uniref:Eco57I restriction-modification methylase domain-containing protein n=1 Tax=Acinetobacter seifertii TaxID=1530123 RepID=UPI001906382F|nr:N-6 DNA methylase [Acinetobacter seifertii]MBJ9422625.1 N-6 DNA methylase [Acinetobacter seifertii]
MKLEDLNLLRDYTTGINDVNRIIVTAFLQSNNIVNVNNEYISKLVIGEKDSDYESFLKFGSTLSIITFDDLIKSFEYIISPVDKVVTGAVYTPEIIRKNIIDNILAFEVDSKEEVKICDPACGCGGFLYSAVKKIKELNPALTFNEIYKKYIFGLDLKDYSVERTKILLNLLAIVNGEDRVSFEFNLYTGNALSFNWEEAINDFKGFDIIVGNPPYVTSRNIEDDSLELLKRWKVCSTGHPDLYIPFFEIGLSILKEGGVLGFITMNTFFKSINGRALRKYLGERKYKLSITDFGSTQVFLSRNTYTCVCIIEKHCSEEIYYRKLENLTELDLIKYSKISYDSMDHLGGWNLNNISIVSKIEKVGVPLKDLYKVNNGIATLKNNIYIIDHISEDEDNYILSCGAKIEKNICVDIINPNKLIDTSNLDELKKKIIFPYKYEENIAKIISLKEFKKEYPNTYSYLLKHKDDLAGRDKGKREYEEWYAYGRRQGMVKHKYQLFFPHISPKIPNYVISEQEDLLFHNGLAILSNERESLEILKVLMSSRLFWFYVINTSKPYGSGYFSFSRNYIKSFGIYEFNEEQKKFLLSGIEKTKIDKFIEKLYDINLDSLV